MIEISLDSILSHKVKYQRDYSNGGFYMIENIKNGMRYIGKSKDYMNRLKQHTYLSSSKTLIDIALCESLSDFKFYLLSDYKYHGITFFNRRKETIIENELISKFNTKYPIGYNIRHYGHIQSL